MIDVELQFGDMQAADWPAVAEIYKEGIDTGHATFQQDIPGWEEWDAAHLKVCRITVKIKDQLAGWAALTPVSGRCVYAGVAEVSVYIGEMFRGLSIGKRLLEQLILASEHESIWTLQAGIFPENTASLAIHQQAGFRIVGTRERIGKMNGKWRDTMLLERRSSVVGL
jgi:phosphinothricin acetyltransferase